jgi:hypothetical protein
MGTAVQKPGTHQPNTVTCSEAVQPSKIHHLDPSSESSPSGHPNPIYGMTALSSVAVSYTWDDPDADAESTPKFHRHISPRPLRLPARHSPSLQNTKS